MKKWLLIALAVALCLMVCVEVFLDFRHYAPEVSASPYFADLNIGLSPKVLFLNSTPPHLPPESKNPRVLFLGDEMALPLGAFVQKGLAPQFDLINLATPGYGPDQWLFRMRADLNRLKGDAMVLLINSANDFEDVYKNEMFYVKNHATVQPHRLNIAQQLLPALKSQMFFRSLLLGNPLDSKSQKHLVDILMNDSPRLLTSDAPSLQKTMLMHHVIAEFQRFADSEHRGFLVVILPSPLSVFNKTLDIKKKFLNEIIVEHLCKSYHIPVLNLTTNIMDKPDTFFKSPQTLEFNETSKQKLAATIDAFLRTHLVSK